MPRQAPRQVVRGPFGGINLSADESLVPDNQFVDGVNVMNVDGTVAPRPGYGSVDMGATFGAIQTGLSDCYGISIDTTNDEIYFIDGYDDISKCPLVGGTKTSLGCLVNPGHYIFSICCYPAGDGSGKALFWTEWDSPSSIKMYRSDLDGVTNRADITPTNLGPGSHIRYDSTNDWVFYSTNKKAIDGSLGSYICRCDAAGGLNHTDVTSALSDYYGFGIDINGVGDVDVFYFSSAYGISTCREDGSSPLEIVSTAQLQSVTGSGTPIVLDIDVDSGGSKVYFVSAGDGIFECTLSGSGLSSTITGSGASSALRIRVDPVDSIGYWVNSTGTTISRGSVAGDVRIISGYHWERSISDVDAGDPNNDLFLLQSYDADTSASENYFNAVLPARGESFSLKTRSDENSGSPSFVVTNDRDTDATDGSTILTGSGRASYTYGGYGLDTLKGGVYIAAGEQPYNFNQLVPQTGPVVVYVYINPLATAGTWKLTDGAGNATAALDWDAERDEVKSAIEGLATATGTVDITFNNIGGSTDHHGCYWRIEFDSTYSPGDDGCTFTVHADTAISVNGSPPTSGEALSVVHYPRWPDGLMMLIPLGLPKAPKPVAVSFATGPGPNGDYTYRASFYSSFLNMEGPLSDESVTISPSDQAGSLTLTIPDTMYFGSWSASTGVLKPGLIDRIRLYRKRTSATNHWDTWYLVDEYELDFGIIDTAATYPVYNPATRKYRLSDTLSDDTVYASFQAMPNIEHPPNDAQYVEMHGSRLFIIGRDGTVWYSGVSGVASGELGHAYFPNSNYFTLPGRASDEKLTGIKSWGGNLYIFSPYSVWMVRVSQDEFVDAVKIPGAPGCASHWTIVESPAMPDVTGYMLYGNQRGIYAFDGQQAIRMVSFDNLGVVETSYHDITARPTYLDYWYYATAALDPYTNSVVFTTFEDNGASENTPLTINLSFLTKAWFKWTLNGSGTTAPHLWLSGREWTSGVGENRPILIFSDSDGNLFKLDEDGNDNGTAFDWYWKTGLWDIGDITLNKPFGEFTTLWNDGTSTVTLDAWINGETSVTQAATALSATQRMAQIVLRDTGRSAQLKAAGTVTASSGTADRPKLVAVALSMVGNPNNARG